MKIAAIIVLWIFIMNLRVRGCGGFIALMFLGLIATICILKDTP